MPSLTCVVPSGLTNSMHRMDFHRLIPSRISSEVRSEDYFELVGLMVEGVGARELPSVIDDHIFLACSWRVQGIGL